MTRLPTSSWRSAAKRVSDVAIAGGVLAATAPLLGAAMLAVRTALGAPVFFRQQRPGIGGEAFELLKLRTMAHPKPGEEGAEHDAKRLGRLGRFLRAASIDELPTLLNVLRGDMSIVGPRPLLMRYLPRYSAEQARRHDVRPGITGWAQVNGRNRLSWDEKFSLDVWYVDNWSLLLDLRIMLKTAARVLRQSDIAADGHATMPEFMGTHKR